jgi:hypothetical protein
MLHLNCRINDKEGVKMSSDYYPCEFGTDSSNKCCKYCGAKIDCAEIRCGKCGEVYLLPKLNGIDFDRPAKEIPELKKLFSESSVFEDTATYYCKYCGVALKNPLLPRCDKCDAIWKSGYLSGQQSVKTELSNILNSLDRLARD